MRIAILGLCAIAVFGEAAAAQQQTDSITRRQQRTIDSLATALAALSARIDSVGASAGSAAAAPVRTSGAYMNIGFVTLADAGWSTQADPRTILFGDHDPKVRGFTMPNTELTFDGAVDPYFKGFANIVYKLDEHAETGVELEEAYAITTSLPANLQLKFGQFFADFGRQNNQHPHAWGFLDIPVVLSRVFGPDGLRSQGVRLSWLAPTSFYTEAMVSVMNSTGGTTFSFRSDESADIHGGVPIERPTLSFKDMLIVPRIASSFDLSDTQTLVVGVSGAFGPNNSGTDASTKVYGVDGYWKWKSATAEQGFPFLSLQAEALQRKYDAAARPAAADPTTTLVAQTLSDRGGYAQLLWGIKPRIVAGLRGELASGDAAPFVSELRNDRTRISPNFTWYPTEFSKIRFQYNYDIRKDIKNDHSLWVQVEFLLGAHAAHKF